MRITFRLKTGRDDDLIRWLEGLPGDPSKSSFIRQAIRQQVSGGTVQAFPGGKRVSAKRKPLKPEKQEPVITDTMPEAAEVDLEAKLDALF